MFFGGEVTLLSQIPVSSINTQPLRLVIDSSSPWAEALKAAALSISSVYGEDVRP